MDTGTSNYRGRITIGLYNTYNPVKFMEAHRRAMCRAGALAEGFDCNLAFFGFPVPQEVRTPLEITEWATSNTTIGNEGENFVNVARAGRVSFFDFSRKGGFPPQLGEPVITTCRPEPEKSINPEEVVRMLKKKSLLLLFGLGHKGLPEEIKVLGKYHLDITGKGASLETATAMGAVIGALAVLLKVKAIKE
ncbi:MAG: DUF531 family protein [Thermoplasmata archaeon]